MLRGRNLAPRSPNLIMQNAFSSLSLSFLKFYTSILPSSRSISEEEWILHVTSELQEIDSRQPFLGNRIGSNVKIAG